VISCEAEGVSHLAHCPPLSPERISATGDFRISGVVAAMRPTRGDGLLTTPQAARMVGVTPATVRKWKQRGWLAPQGLDEHGYPLYTRQAVREAERLVRENGLRTSGVDPRALRQSARKSAGIAA
jgi:hypothetical protein